MRILFVSLYFPPATYYGGPLASGWALCRSWSEAGHDVGVVTTNANGPEILKARVGWREIGKAIHVRYCRRLAGEHFAPGMVLAALWQTVRRDTIYVWGFFVWILPFIVAACTILRKHLIISPRGMLATSALSKGSQMKSAFIRLLRALNVERVAVFHATSEPEAADIRRIFSRSRVFVVPNGVWCPSDIDVQSARRNRKIGEDYVLFLGRLDPYKQIEKIIEAFSKVVRGNHDGDQPGKLRLCVAGVGDESYLSILRRTAEEMKLAGEIDFLGHIEGKDKVAVLANASVLVLASKTENFGMSVAEALAWGVPVVASWGTPWQELDNRGCGRWVEDSADNLADAIRSIIALSAAERGQMGLRGRAWMADEYRWDCLARKTINLR